MPSFAQGSRRFTLGHTWDGAPLACAVGLAVLEAMRTEGLVERVHDRGAQLLGELQNALAGIPLIREVRGHGYLLGVSFVDPRDGVWFLRPVAGVGARIPAAAFDRELIVLSTQPTRDGYAGDQTLFAPAFTATDDELGEMVSRFAEVVRSVAADVEPELARAEPIRSASMGGAR